MQHVQYIGLWIESSAAPWLGFLPFFHLQGIFQEHLSTNNKAHVDFFLEGPSLGNCKCSIISSMEKYR